MLEANARSAGKHKDEQKVNNIDEWVLGRLAARTGTGVQMDYGRLCACLSVAKMRAASVSNTLRKSQEPLFHFAKTDRLFYLNTDMFSCLLSGKFDLKCVIGGE